MLHFALILNKIFFASPLGVDTKRSQKANAEFACAEGQCSDGSAPSHLPDRLSTSASQCDPSEALLCSRAQRPKWQKWAEWTTGTVRYSPP